MRPRPTNKNMIPNKLSQTIQPARHLSKNMMMKLTMIARPKAAKSQYQLFLISLIKSARVDWFMTEEYVELTVAKALLNMAASGTQTRFRVKEEG